MAGFVSLMVGCADARIVETELLSLDVEAPPEWVTPVLSTNTQAVAVRFLPAFSTTLADSGIAPLEPLVRDSLLGIVQAAFEPYDFAVSEAGDVWTDPEQTLTIDIAGVDPNGLGLPAHDNSTDAKDTGNLVRDEVLGGENPAVDTPFGGVFAAEIFARFAEPDHEVGAVFAPVAPAQGGLALRTYPGSRDDERAVALAHFAAWLVASATVHTIGHALGLAVGGPTVFHNKGDNGCYMDHGKMRSPDERGRLYGDAERWCPLSEAYLNEIAPP